MGKGGSLARVGALCGLRGVLSPNFSCNMIHHVSCCDEVSRE